MHDAGKPKKEGRSLWEKEGARVRVEVPRSDKVAEPAALRLPPKRKYARVKRQVKITTLCGLRDSLENCDTEWAKCVMEAERYRTTRHKEMQMAHGHVSAGVGGMLASSALAMATSRYLYRRAVLEGDTQLAKEGAKFASESKNLEAMAWELCSREGTVRARQEKAELGVPWLRRAADGTLQPKKKPGRPRKDAQSAEAAGETFLKEAARVAERRVVNAWVVGDSETGRSGPGSEGGGNT